MLREQLLELGHLELLSARLAMTHGGLFVAYSLASMVYVEYVEVMEGGHQQRAAWTGCGGPDARWSSVHRVRRATRVEHLKAWLPHLAIPTCVLVVTFDKETTSCFCDNIPTSSPLTPSTRHVHPLKQPRDRTHTRHTHR